MNIITKISALALLCGWQFVANATTQENVYDFANNNLNLEVATPADWEDPTKGVISGQELRQGDVVLTSVDGAKPNRTTSSLPITSPMVVPSVHVPRVYGGPTRLSPSLPMRVVLSLALHSKSRTISSSLKHKQEMEN